MAKMDKWKVTSIIMISLIIMALFAGVGVYAGVIKIGSVSNTELAETTVDANVIQASCPSTFQTAGEITMKNDEDDTKDDTFDVTAYLYKVIGGVESYSTSITDTTAGSATLDCLKTYRLKPISSDADEGDNAKLNRVVAGENAKLVDGGKAVEFTPSGYNYALKLGGERHGVLQFKAFDNVQNGWMCNSDDTCTDYEADGVTFESTTNASAMAIGATDEVDVNLHFRGTKTNTSFDDFGYYILVEAGTDTATVWQEPVLTLNGQRLNKVALTGDEARAWQAYDWAFKVEGHDISDADNELVINMKPQASQNPSTDLQFDFASIGAFLSTDGSTVKYGGAKDDTSATVVFTVQDVTVDIS